MRPVMTTEQARLEVKSIQDVDPKIVELLIGFRRWGVETLSSCQGHLNILNSGLRYPWIDCSSQSIERAVELLALYPHYYAHQRNLLSPVWVIRSHFGMFRIIPEVKPWWKLWLLQRDATRFGLFLQNIPSDFIDELEKCKAEI